MSYLQGLKNLKSFGNLKLLVPGLENLIKSHGYWHFGYGDFIFHNESNVYLALILFFSPQFTWPFPTNMTKEVGNHCVHSSWQR
jgi:hypothetical protein